MARGIRWLARTETLAAWLLDQGAAIVARTAAGEDTTAARVEWLARLDDYNCLLGAGKPSYESGDRAAPGEGGS